MIARHVVVPELRCQPEEARWRLHTAYATLRLVILTCFLAWPSYLWLLPLSHFLDVGARVSGGEDSWLSVGGDRLLVLAEARLFLTRTLVYVVVVIDWLRVTAQAAAGDRLTFAENLERTAPSFVRFITVGESFFVMAWSTNPGLDLLIVGVAVTVANLVRQIVALFELVKFFNI